MKAKLIKKDGHYFLEVEPNTWTPPNRFHSIIANTIDKPKGDVLQLSVKNCQAIERGFDLEELANEWVFETNGHKWSNNDDTAGDNYASFKAGFQKALELMGDKKFSEDDVKNIFAKTLENAPSTESHTRMISDVQYRHSVMDELYDRITKLQQQTEWDVEITTENVCARCYSNDTDECWSAKECSNGKYDYSKPILDVDGCLILRRIN